MNNFAKFFKRTQMFVSKHSPEILTGVGIAGMVTTTVLAVKATPKALRLIEMKKEEEQTDILTPIDTVKAAWKCYIPSVALGATSIACLVGASSVNLRRNAALATAYKLSETALSEYREKVVETLGEKKERAVRDKVDKERIEKNPVANTEVYVTGNGKSLCYDYYSGRYFESDIELIKKAINELNKRMIHDIFGYVSLNDLYDELGLPNTGTGDVIGWNVQKGLIKDDLGAQLATDGRPCVVLNFEVGPYHDYDKFQ